MISLILKISFFSLFEQRNAMDLHNISPEFTNEQIPNSLCRSSSMGPSSIPEHHFQGFSYAAPNL